MSKAKNAREAEAKATYRHYVKTKLSVKKLMQYHEQRRKDREEIFRRLWRNGQA